MSIFLPTRRSVVFASLSAFAVVVLLGVAKAAQPSDAEVRLLFTYGSEKDLWLKEVTKQFHDQKMKTADGRIIHVDLEPMGSGQCIWTLLQGGKQAHLTSPASQVWINLANDRYRATAGAREKEPFIEVKGRLVRSPVVLAMWSDMVKAAGWEGRPVGWNHLADLIDDLAKEGKGWAARGHNEWGRFKFAHTHPELSNSGLLGVLAIAYARADSSRALSADDFKKPDIRSAAILYESEVIRLNKTRKRPEQLVAIYPAEGTFWSDHPAGLVRGPWVTPVHREAAQKYLDYLLAEPQQKRALAHGFRPGPGDAKSDAKLGEPFTAALGVDPAQPRTVLTAPDSGVVEAVLQLWQREQRGVRVVLALDVSFSMKSYGKLERAREAAVNLVHGLSETSRLTLVAFNHDVRVLLRDVALDAHGKEEVIRSLMALQPRGGTHLYDAVVEACDVLTTPPDSRTLPDRKTAMQAVVLLSDGQDHGSRTTLSAMHTRLSAGEGKVPIFFSIAYGATDNDKDDPDPPDRPLLEKIASESGGRAFSALPRNIDKVLDDISGFFGAKPRSPNGK
jgi:Ca-activated chloride channel family protein